MARLLAWMSLVVVLGGIACVASAAATPTVSLTVRALPVRGLPHTGNRRGAGATVEIHVAITGTEYGGYPPPLTRLVFPLPAGMRWDTAGFPVCREPEVAAIGPGERPCQERRPMTGPPVQMNVAFGRSTVPETAQTWSYYDPLGGITVGAYGHEPATVDLLVEGTVGRLDDGGTQLVFPFPLLETVPGADYASMSSFTLLAGSARPLAHGHAFSLRMPRKCPHGSLTYGLQASFAGPTPATVSSTYRARCPKR